MTVFFSSKCIQRSILALALVSLISGCSQPPQLEKLEGFAQGTTYHISWWSEDDVPAADVKKVFDKTLAQIDKELSTYRDDSYISKFNNSHSTDWQPASPDFIQLIDIAKDIDSKTQGCYDPTIGPLFSLWGFQDDVLNVPTETQIQVVKNDLGMDKIEVDKEHLRIRKTLPTIQLNFSSMGEGYTIGKLSAILEEKGVKNYLVEFGGDMKIRGHKPGGEKWRIAIEKPRMNQDQQDRTPYQILTIQDENGVTLDTSGTYRHHLDANGKEYSHILDPRRGAPVTHNLISASVFGTDSRVSDAWATAMLCMGQKEGMQVAQKEGLSVFFIQNEEGKLVNSQSQHLKDSKRVTLEAQ